MLSEEDRLLIKGLRGEKRYSGKKIITEFPKKK